MKETLNDSNKENNVNFLRYFWIALIPIFFVLLLSNLYNWQNGGKNQLDDILTNLGFIFLGSAALVTARRKGLHYSLQVIALILLLSGIALWLFNYL